MLNEVIENTERFIASVPKAKRKKYGQFFTNSTTAKFMASLFCFDLSKQKIEILDAGAGTGILAAAVVQKLYELGYMGKIYVTCYKRSPFALQNESFCTPKGVLLFCRHFTPRRLMRNKRTLCLYILRVSGAVAALLLSSSGARLAADFMA